MPQTIKFPVPTFYRKGFVFELNDSIIAMSLENHQMKIHKSQHLSNVSELKTVIPYYS